MCAIFSIQLTQGPKIIELNLLNFAHSFSKVFLNSTDVIYFLATGGSFRTVAMYVMYVMPSAIYFESHVVITLTVYTQAPTLVLHPKNIVTFYG